MAGAFRKLYGGDAQTIAIQQAVEDALRRREREPLAAGAVQDVEVLGSRGRIASGIATPTITLQRAADAANIRVGHVVQLSAVDGDQGNPAARAGSVTVTAVDRVAGTVTASGNWNAGVPTGADLDSIYRTGEVGRATRIPTRLGRRAQSFVIAGASGTAGRPPSVRQIASDKSVLTVQATHYARARIVTR